MINNLLKLRYIVLILILGLGLYLRHHNLYTWPRLGATFDEYAWTWLGMSLIQNKYPQSWSPHPQYKIRQDIKYQGAHFMLVKPYLEHPPLFGLVAGSYAVFNGAKGMLSLTLQNIRGLALLLGVLSIFIIYIFAAQVYGYKIGLLSSFIYAIVPTIAVGSRIVENENFFIPFFLLSLFLISKFINTGNPHLRNLAAVICGLLTLAKVPWIAGAFAIFFIFVYLRKYRDGFKFIAIVIPIFLSFIAYGISFDAKLFTDLWIFQLQRYDLAFNSFFAVFTSPYLVDRLTIDGWIYLGWFTILMLGLKDFKKNYLILIPFLAYLGIFIFAIPNEPSHGWYRYPFYPFLVISTALFLVENFNKNYFITFIFLIFTGLSMLQLSWAQSIGFSFIIFRSYILLFSLSLAPIFLPKTKKYIKILNLFSFVLIVALSCWSIYIYNEQ